VNQELIGIELQGSFEVFGGLVKLSLLGQNRPEIVLQLGRICPFLLQTQVQQFERV
jgi:hypothetical protein